MKSSAPQLEEYGYCISKFLDLIVLRKITIISFSKFIQSPCLQPRCVWIRPPLISLT